MPLLLGEAPCEAGHARRAPLLDCAHRLAHAVRVEVGYLSHPGDAARLADPAFRDTLAEAIGAAVQRLYLAPEDDAVTGVLRIPEWLRA